MQQNTRQRGSIAVVLIAIFVLGGLAGGGWYVWSKNKTPSQDSKQIGQKSQSQNRQEQKPTDPYEGWKAYGNADYGISFKYPSDWRLDESGVKSSSESLLKLEYAINLKRNEEAKYNNTIAIEILDQPLSEVELVQDRLLGQSTNPIQKTNDSFGGKEGVQYVITGRSSKEKVYLIAVGIKVYLFRSVNDEPNIQFDKNYWTKFDKVFESLNITK